MGHLSMRDSRHCEEHVCLTHLQSLGGLPRGGKSLEKLRPLPNSEEAHGSSCVVLVNIAALLCVGDERTQMPRIVTQRDRVAWMGAGPDRALTTAAIEDLRGVRHLHVRL